MDIRENQHGECPGQERKAKAAYPFDDKASMTTVYVATAWDPNTNTDSSTSHQLR